MNSKPIQSAFLAAMAATTLVAGAVSPAMARNNDPAKEAKAKQDDQSDAAMQKKYCVQGPSTGTMFPKRECHTRAEWIAATGQDPAKIKKN
ncbi:hypothetical protein HZY97_13820 [Sphingomonas sp. R-74633]|uniref:hypothetical protein n=1 Tax=Sphingomonas sp. R-74633 TaxID=2751188 RepID=UPI0015D22764|nr:hypothetical protein [Sphingomonas sp. R-74633]NYT41844.1 hypothetical protein [Sphingomonas sp. R-74633]